MLALSGAMLGSTKTNFDVPAPRQPLRESSASNRNSRPSLCRPSGKPGPKLSGQEQGAVLAKIRSAAKRSAPREKKLRFQDADTPTTKGLCLKKEVEEMSAKPDKPSEKEITASRDNVEASAASRPLPTSNLAKTSVAVSKTVVDKFTDVKKAFCSPAPVRKANSPSGQKVAAYIALTRVAAAAKPSAPSSHAKEILMLAGNTLAKNAFAKFRAMDSAKKDAAASSSKSRHFPGAKGKPGNKFGFFKAREDGKEQGQEIPEPQEPTDKSGIPDWARGPNLAALLDQQYGGPNPINPDTIFSTEVFTCNLDEIFNTKKSKWARTSSENWHTDPLTIAEKRAYERAMGYN